MPMNVRTFKEIRRTYGYDEVAIAPGAITINPELANLDFTIDGLPLSTPVLSLSLIHI